MWLVARLTFDWQHDDGPSLPVTGGVQFGVQPTLGVPDATQSRSISSRLAAVQRTLRWIASIIDASHGPVHSKQKSTNR
jgi:hypothetical protein